MRTNNYSFSLQCCNLFTILLNVAQRNSVNVSLVRKFTGLCHDISNSGEFKLGGGDQAGWGLGQRGLAGVCVGLSPTGQNDIACTFLEIFQKSYVGLAVGRLVFPVRESWMGPGLVTYCSHVMSPIFTACNDEGQGYVFTRDLILFTGDLPHWMLGIHLARPEEYCYPPWEQKPPEQTLSGSRPPPKDQRQEPI